MKMYVNGKPADSLSKETMDVIAPADGSLLDTVPKASKEDIALAFTYAEQAKKQWANTPLYERSQIISRFVELVRENLDSLALTLSRDNGKPITQARGELSNIFTAVPAFIEKAKHLYETILPAGIERGHEHNLQMVTRKPVGIVVCIIPFNFPSNMFCQKVIPSLLMGNATIALPPSANPLTILRLTELMQKAGIPDGVLQCLTAPGSVKEAAVTDPRTDFITLTGSTKTGKHIAKLASDHLVPCALELGGNDAFIVMEDADLDTVISQIIPGRMTNCGQICCASKRFLIHESLVEEFTRRTIETLKGLTIGKPEEESTQLACLITETAAKEVEAQVNLTVEQGARILYGGKRNGAYYEPTVLTDITPEMDIFQDMEVFGPVIPILSFQTEEEAIEIANHTHYGLAGSIFTNDHKRMFRMSRQLEAGNIIINGASFLRSFEMPFGGWKESGIGTEGVMTTFQEMTKIKMVVLKDVF